MTVVYLGTENYPLIDFDEMSNLGARASDLYPIKLETSVIPPEGVDLNDYIYGLYIRNLPTRGLLRATNSEMDRRNQINDSALKTFSSGFLGAPGTGKTFFFNVLGKIVHEKGPILIDCSDKDLKTLFENPTFDSDAANREKNALDAKIKLRNMGKTDSISDKSLSMLKQIVGNAWHEEEGQITIDWSAIRFEGKDMADYERHIRIFQNVLREICSDEGINIARTSTDIGITMEDGELFRVFDPQSPDYGRPIILDELNRAKRGTLDNLYGVLNFLNSPNMRTFTIYGANSRELTIDKDSPTFPKTFYLNFTGNQAVAGMGSNMFNDPFLSRMPEGFALKTIPDTQPDDYADMICSYLTGVPAMTLCGAFNIDTEDTAEINNFISFLKSARTIGLTEKEQRSIPEWQMHNIDNIVKIIPLAQKMGQFFYDIKELMQQRGNYAEKIANISIEPEYERYLKSKTIDYRIIPHFFIQADQIKGQVYKTKQPVLGSKNKKAKAPVDISKSNRYATRGHRLQSVIKDWLEQTFIPVDKGVRQITEETVKVFYQMALECAYMNGILPEKQTEAKQTGSLIADLYNIEVREAGLYFKQLQSLIVKSLRRNNSDIQPDESDEDILPVGVVQATMALLAQNEGKSILATAHEANNLLVINENVDEVGNKMLAPVSLENNTSNSDITDENLLLSLSLDGIKEQNLKKLFQITPQFAELCNSETSNKNMDDFDDIPVIERCRTYLDYDCDEIKDENNDVINSSTVKFGFYKTKSALTGEPSYLLAFYDKQHDHLIIIGDEISSEVEVKFSKAGSRTYFNRSKTNVDIIAQNIRDLFDTSGDSFLTECDFFDAFGWKNLNSDEALTLEDVIQRTAGDYTNQDSRATVIKYATEKSGSSKKIGKPMRTGDSR